MVLAPPQSLLRASLRFGVIEQSEELLVALHLGILLLLAVLNRVTANLRTLPYILTAKTRNAIIVWFIKPGHLIYPLHTVFTRPSLHHICLL